MYLHSKPKSHYLVIVLVAIFLFFLPFNAVIKEILVFLSQRINFTSKETEKEIEKLKKENLALTFQLEEFESLAEENKKLKSALDFKNQKEIVLTGVEIVAFVPSNWERSVFVNSGSEDGLAIGAFVLNEEGDLFGKITEVKKNSAKVVMVSDPNFNLPVFLGDKSFGLLRGTLVDAKISYVEDGENLKKSDEVWFKIPPFASKITIGKINSIHKSINDLFWEIEVSLPPKNRLFNKLFVVK